LALIFSTPKNVNMFIW